MRKSSLTLLAVAIGLAAGQASAADLPRKAPAYVPAPPPMTWTGCYIGGNVGAAWGRFELETPFGEDSRSRAGFAGGGQIGCDYQFAGGWVIGIRNMFDWTSNSRERTFVFDGVTGTAELRNRWFDTLTGRVGYSWQPTSLLYFQGGAVWSRVEADLLLSTGQAFSASDTKTGWTVGAGYEYRFSPQWSVFVEGNYMNFGTRDGTLFGPTACVAGCLVSFKTTGATALVGVNYRFWSGL